jgi:FlaA1/EpsC-like NDP-sugar epimerase
MKKSDFKGKTVIVTGGTGSIGSEIVRYLLNTEVKQIRVYSRDEHKQHELSHELTDDRLRFLIGDVRDKDRMDFAFRGTDVCFHAAALKHVPSSEYNPFEAVKTNVIGTQNVIELAIKHDLEKVIAISTDKAVDPISVLGATKLMMERLISAANAAKGHSRTTLSSVRFGNVLNSRGSVVTLWQKQIESGQPVTVTDRRATRFFMEIPEAVDLIFTAYELMQGGEVFVLKMKRKKKILDFAREVIAAHAPGKKVPIQFIGMRPGERLHEILLTEDETGRAVEVDNLFVILPKMLEDTALLGTSLHYPGMKKVRRRSYTSE